MVIVFGEAIVDLFSDNTSALGGTGFNTAFHLQQLGRYFGFQADLVTRIGNDEYGDRVRGLLSPGKLVQVHPYMSTGVVYIDIAVGDTIGKAEVRTPIPWEGFDPGCDLRNAAAQCGAVVFGTLAQLIPSVKAALLDFLGSVPNAIRLYDLNLRTDASGNLFDTKTVLTSIEAATIVKMNVAELIALNKMVHENRGHRFRSDPMSDDCIQACVENVQPLMDEKIWVVTAGPKGTTVYRKGVEPVRRKPFWKKIMWDVQSKPAGAGDACTAGLLAGIISGWSVESSVDLANIMGAFVSSQPSAAPIISKEIVDFLSVRYIPGYDIPAPLSEG